MKAQITRKKINLTKLFFVNKVRAGTSNSLQYLIWLNSKTVKIFSIVQSVKLLLALSIYTYYTIYLSRFMNSVCSYFRTYMSQCQNSANFERSKRKNTNKIK